MTIKLTKGAFLLPTRTISVYNIEKDYSAWMKEKIDRPDQKALVNTFDMGEPLLIVENGVCKNGIWEIKCLAKEKLVKIYMSEERVSYLFVTFPGIDNKTNLSEEEEWLTSQYFKVRGGFFGVSSHRRPKIVYKDYDWLKQTKFVSKKGQREIAIQTQYDKVPKNSLSKLVVGNAIRIRAGSRKLIFQFYEVGTGLNGFWEFNNNTSPIKTSKLFEEYWYRHTPSRYLWSKDNIGHNGEIVLANLIR